jgi:hypothetical protein
LSRWNGGSWDTVNVNEFMPEGWEAIDGPMTVDTQDRIHLALTAFPEEVLKRGEKMFGQPSSEVFHACSTDGGRSFTCRQVSKTDPGTANWHPSISQPGPYHPVEHPVILYTHGNTQTNEEAKGCRHTVETEITCVFVEG